MFWHVLIGCAPDSMGPAALDTASDELTPVFSYAIIADPHVTGSGDHDARLQAAVAETNARVASEGIELVFILGDIAWGDGYDLAHAALEELTVPWVPVLGDNPIQVGEETGFEVAFSGQLDALADQVDGWERAPRPVYNPERDEDSWLQNARLDHKGVRFVAMDWNSRESGIIGETPDLHDFAGGSLPFLGAALESLPDGPDKRVVLLSHMAPFPGPGGLMLDEQEKLIALLQPHTDAVWGNHAGHLHINSGMTWDALDIELVTTDATWDDLNTIRIVQVLSSAATFAYLDEIITFD